MKKNLLIVCFFFELVIVSRQKLPEYHRNVINTYQTPQRGIFLSAIKSQKLSLVDSLIKQGYDINEPNVYGMTILAEALNTLKDTSFIDSLLTRGVCLIVENIFLIILLKKGHYRILMLRLIMQ